MKNRVHDYIKKNKCWIQKSVSHNRIVSIQIRKEKQEISSNIDNKKKTEINMKMTLVEYIISFG